MHGKKWEEIAKHIRSRNDKQIKTHAQLFCMNMGKQMQAIPNVQALVDSMKAQNASKSGQAASSCVSSDDEPEEEVEKPGKAVLSRTRSPRKKNQIPENSCK